MAGNTHTHTPFLTDGRSLHPLQRLGHVEHSGLASIGVASAPSFGNRPSSNAPAMVLGSPPTLTVGQGGTHTRHSASHL